MVASETKVLGLAIRPRLPLRRPHGSVWPLTNFLQSISKETLHALIVEVASRFFSKFVKIKLPIFSPRRHFRVKIAHFFGGWEGRNRRLRKPRTLIYSARHSKRSRTNKQARPLKDACSPLPAFGLEGQCLPDVLPQVRQNRRHDGGHSR